MLFRSSSLWQAGEEEEGEEDQKEGEQFDKQQMLEAVSFVSY